MPHTLAIDHSARPPAPAGDHVREHRSMLAAGEKRALIWLAHRLPDWVTSDQLTLLGLSSMVLAGLAFAFASRYPASLSIVVVALALNWFGDSLDGTLARVRNQQRPRYGFYVDHVIDLAGVTVLLGGLAWSSFMSPLVATVLLTAYLLVAGESFLATHALGVFRLSFSGLGPTELRLLLAAGALYLMRGGWVTVYGIGPVRLFDVGGLIAACGLAVVFIWSAIRNTRALHVAEPLRPRRGM